VSVVVLSVAAAVRSTWSPCGLSMLASITPLSQGGRGHGYRATTIWFVVGGVLGGLTLGAVMAALALGVGALSLTPTGVAGIALALTLLSVASDAGVGGFHLPVHHRQVNERWLDQYRPWVYGAGFGFQIGAGLATYIRTAAVYLLIALGALSGDPGLALLAGGLFGLVRGNAVFLGRGIVSSATLSAFHRRFQQWGPVVRLVVIGVQAAVAEVLAGLVSPWAALVLALALLPLLARQARQARQGHRATTAERPVATIAT